MSEDIFNPVFEPVAQSQDIFQPQIPEYFNPYESAEEPEPFSWYQHVLSSIGNSFLNVTFPFLAPVKSMFEPRVEAAAGLPEGAMKEFVDRNTQGESRFEQAFDMMYGAGQAPIMALLHDDPNETSFAEDIANAQRKNYLYDEVLKSQGVQNPNKAWYHPSQFTYNSTVLMGNVAFDLLNFVPDKYAKKVFDPLATPIKVGWKGLGWLLGKSDSWVGLAQKFSKTAYRGIEEKSLLQELQEQTGITFREMEKAKENIDFEAFTTKAMDRVSNWANEKGLNPLWAQKIVLQSWEDNIERIRLFEWAKEGNVGPLKPLDTWEEKLDFLKTVDVRKIADATEVEELEKYMLKEGLDKFVPKHNIPDFVVNPEHPTIRKIADAQYGGDYNQTVQSLKDYTKQASDEIKTLQDELKVLDFTTDSSEKMAVYKKLQEIKEKQLSTQEILDEVPQGPLYFKEPVEFFKETTVTPTIAPPFRRVLWQFFNGTSDDSVSFVRDMERKYGPLLTSKIIDYLDNKLPEKDFLNFIKNNAPDMDDTLAEAGYQFTHKYDDIVTDEGYRSIASGDKLAPSTVPLTDIPVKHATDMDYPGGYFGDNLKGGRRGGLWFFYGHGDTPYQKEFAGGKTVEGGKNKFDMTVSPKRPLVFDAAEYGMSNDWAGHGAVKYFIGKTPGEMSVDELWEEMAKWATPDEYRWFKATADGWPEGKMPKYILGDMLGTTIAKRKGYDAIITLDRKGEYPLHEIVMLNSLKHQIEQGVVPNILKEVGAIRNSIELLPIHLPDDVVEAAYQYKRSMDDLLLRDARNGGNTPELQDTLLSYVLHMTTKDFRKIYNAAFKTEGMRKIPFLDPKHQSMLTRQLRHYGIVDVNSLYNSAQGFEINGVVFRSKFGQLEKEYGELMKLGKMTKEEFDTKMLEAREKLPMEMIFEDDPVALELFRTLRSIQFEGTIKALHHATKKYGWDASIIKTQIKNLRKEGWKIERAMTKSFEKHGGILDDSGNLIQMTEDEFYAQISELRKTYKTFFGSDSEAIKYYLKQEIPEGYRRLAFVRTGNPVYKNLIEAFKDQYFAPEIAKHLDAYFEMTMNPDASSAFWSNAYDIFDQVRSNYVIGTLYGFPGSISTMLKNFVGNYHNNTLKGVSEPKWYMYASQLQKMKGQGGHIFMKRSDGTTAVLNEAQVWKIMEDLGIASTDAGAEAMQTHLAKYYKDPLILRKIKTKGGFKEALKTSGIEGVKEFGKNVYNLHPTLLKNTAELYRGIEDNARVAHFLKKYVDEGMDPIAARASVKETLFDYLDLTDFERKIRTFVPFYTWTRNNLPLQIKAMLENPIRPTNVQLSHLVNMVRDNETAREMDKYHSTDLPKFVKDMVGIPVRKGEDGLPVYFLFGSWVPAMEVEQLFTANSVLRKAWGLLAPYLKEGPEQLAGPGGYDFYQQREIEKFPGEVGKSELFGERRKRFLHMIKMFRFAKDVDGMARAYFEDRITDPTQAERIREVIRMMFFGGGTIRIDPIIGLTKRMSKIKQLEMRMEFVESKAQMDAIMEEMERLLSED